MKSVIGHRAERSHDGSSALTLACALLATLACAKGALDLAPFPCADDNGCPAGTLCLPGSAADAGSSCVAPQVNALCATTADCAGVSATAVCDQGRCRAACNSGAGCAGSDLCSSSSGPGVCLTACTSGATCPAGLSCGLLAPGRRE